MRRRAQAALAVLLVPGAVAAAPPLLTYHGKNRYPLEPADAAVYRAPHFDVHYPLAAEPDLPRLVELAEAAWRRLAADLGHEPEGRVPLLAAAGRDALER